MACNVLDDDQPTAPTMNGNSADLLNFIIGSPDVAAWGGQYVKDNTYFMLNIPIVGALKVEYCVKGGGCFALFVETTTPTKMEIGLQTVEGTMDVLDSVCVTYLENGAFGSVPANHEKTTQHGAMHYQRTLDNGGVENWWPVDAAFVFGGETTTVCVVTDGLVQGAEVSGPFPKPMPVAPTPVCKPVGGYCWILAAQGASCDAACGDVGLTCDLAGTTAYGSGGTDAMCDNLLIALGVSTPGTSSGTFGPRGCYFFDDGQATPGRRSTDATTCDETVGSPRRRACACRL